MRDVVDEVLWWDVVDGGMLGALIRCRACPCRDGTGCDGTRVMFRGYRLPGGAPLDLYRDADLLVNVLDRSQPARPEHG